MAIKTEEGGKGTLFRQGAEYRSSYSECIKHILSLFEMLQKYIHIFIHIYVYVYICIYRRFNTESTKKSAIVKSTHLILEPVTGNFLWIISYFPQTRKEKMKGLQKYVYYSSHHIS